MSLLCILYFCWFVYFIVDFKNNLIRRTPRSVFDFLRPKATR